MMVVGAGGMAAGSLPLTWTMWCRGHSEGLTILRTSCPCALRTTGRRHPRRVVLHGRGSTRHHRRGIQACSTRTQASVAGLHGLLGCSGLEPPNYLAAHSRWSETSALTPRCSPVYTAAIALS